MLEPKTRKELATYAFSLASGHQLVRHRGVTYIPADYETRDVSVPPDIDRTMWLPLSLEQVERMAADEFDILFANSSELVNYDYMVAQNASHNDKPVTSLLVRTQAGLRELDHRGDLVAPSGDFRPNTLVPMLNEDKADKDYVFEVVSGWLNSDEEAESFLKHLASSLSPGWSAVKYILLIGEGRNGKSVALKMLQHLFGAENVSSVTRQMISEQSPVVTELNGKLLNIVFDGQAVYLKDSGSEKSLIAGEPVSIRKLYESKSTQVQTNALFLEGLNREPKTSDKSAALQKRLVRFQFPNVYRLDHRFERRMLSEQMLGALLSLLVDRYILEDAVAGELAPTSRALELQLEQMLVNSTGLQYLKYVEDTEPSGVNSLFGEEFSVVVTGFKSWRLHTENDLGGWSEPDVFAQFQPLLETERKSVRSNEKVSKVRFVVGLKEEAAAFMETQRAEDPHDDIATLVED